MVGSCLSDASQYWIPVLLGYKAVYLVIGLLLAGQTYNVKIKELRDSKLIGVSVYATFVICVVLAVIGFIVVDSPNAFYGLLGSFILALITGVLGLLSLPRVSHCIYETGNGFVAFCCLFGFHCLFVCFIVCLFVFLFV